MSFPYRDAIREAIFEIFSQDERAVIFGEDIAVLGGRFGITQGLLDRFGFGRVKDAPISEEIFIGIGLGASNGGLKPIVEILNSDFLAIAFDDLWRSGIWQRKYPTMVSSDVLVRAGFGAYSRKGPDFSSSAVAHLAAVPNIKIYTPTFPDEACQLLKDAFNRPGLKLFLEHKALYLLQEFPKNNPVNSNCQVLLISYSYLSILSAKAAEALRERGINAGLLDLGIIWPISFEKILSSVKVADAVILVEECVPEAGIMNFIELEIRRKFPEKTVARINAKDAVVPFGDKERTIIPSIDEITEKAFGLAKSSP